MWSLLRSVTLGAAVFVVPAAETANAALKADIEALLAKSQVWLAAQQQDNGAYAPGAKFAVGITGLAVDALASEPAYYPEGDTHIAKALEFLYSYQQPNGGVYADDEGLGNYGTSLALMAMASAKSLDPVRVKKMHDYLFGLQNADEASLGFGGIGYGSRGAGHEDLSNTGMALEALTRSGVPASDPHLEKAMSFLQRCQDLSSHNDQPWAGTSGGGVYTPDESKADGSWDPKKAEPGEKPTSLAPYGGMTYQLISSYVALDLKPGDPRLDAAMTWVKKNYRFDANPGMQPEKNQQGLFYYYMAMAKTFDLLDQGTLELPDGSVVDWRKDLFEAIKAKAGAATLPDGTECVIWINGADRWAEGIPQVTASYLIKALKRIHQAL
jgi:squalene-hopene/tetraprenyl-beta-curcumene cyclase